MILPYEETPLADHVIICGLGHVGSRCLSLLSRLGERGVVITLEANPDLQPADASRFSITLGDAREEMLLRLAGVARAKAVIAATNDDLTNVSIALDAHRLNPRIAIVIRSFDQDLAVHLEKSVHIRRALSASALAAPGFLAAALGDAVQCSFDAEDTNCIVEQLTVEPDSLWIGRKLGQAAAERRVAAIALRQGEATAIPPPADAVVRPGDRLTLLRAEKRRLPTAARFHRVKRKRRFLAAPRAMASGLRQWWREIPRAMRAAAFALLAVVLISVGVFHFALDLPFIDAFYFVITTVTTVGYGDYHLRDAAPWMKLYGSFVMLCGAAIVALLFGIITDMFLRARFRELFARGTAHSQGHIIVAGLGRIGFRLVRDLARRGERVVAIERKESGEFIQAARELVSVVLGNAKTEETLRKAGLAGAKAIVAATDDDLANLSIGLAAKRIHPACRVAMRIFDAALAEKLRQGLSIDAVLSVSGAAAPTFVGSILCPDMLHGMVLDDHLVLFFDRLIPPGSAQLGRPAGRIEENELALLLKRAGTDDFAPAPAEQVLQAGDRVLGARWFPFIDGKRDP
ncbi:MAG: NAD-binding protein [Pirellulales bacterium]|nr:NAD-binding protein [Pirellulales bacterium]